MSVLQKVQESKNFEIISINQKQNIVLGDLHRP